MTTLTTRSATLADAEYLAPRLRKEDVAEIEAIAGCSPSVALTTGILAGEAWTVVDNGEPVAIFGLQPCPTDARIGFPWLLTSDAVTRHPVAFLRRCREYVGKMLERFPILTLIADSRNGLPIEWLERCGFTFTREHDGRGGTRLLQFTLVRPELIGTAAGS